MSLAINFPTKAYLRIPQQQIFLRVLPTTWRRKPAGIDMERNYASITLCIGLLTFEFLSQKCFREAILRPRFLLRPGPTAPICCPLVTPLTTTMRKKVAHTRLPSVGLRS